MHNIVTHVLILCSLCICANCAAGSGAGCTKFQPATATACAISSTQIREVMSPSVAVCTMLCYKSRDIACKSISYHESTGVCQLRNGQDGQFVTKLPDTADPWCPGITVTRDSRTFRVIQQRLQGHIDFTRNWNEYETGFGDSTDFWIGLQSLPSMTSGGKRLRVEATAETGILYVAEYDGFTVADASDKYRMSYSSFVNINMTQDSLSGHKDQQFTTMDSDNDARSDLNCGTGTGGWWFSSCSTCNPNGLFSENIGNVWKRMQWYGAGSSSKCLKNVRLLLQL